MTLEDGAPRLQQLVYGNQDRHSGSDAGAQADRQPLLELLISPRRLASI